MLPERVKAILKAKVSGTISWDEPMKKHTTFGIGGPADALIVPKDESDLRQILHISQEDDVPLTIIGRGSNLLVADDGVDGVVIKISNCFNDVTVEKNRLRAGAGFQLSRLTRMAADAGLTGLEFAVGIPGSVGGAVVMNAGTAEGNMGNVVTNVKAIDRSGELIELRHEELEFAYRDSVLQRRSLILLSVEIELACGSVEEIEKRMQSNRKWRKEQQPIHFRTAGSIFKNPPGDYAGRLIEACECKGMAVGDAQVSDLHANFIVNRGNASAAEVLMLMKGIVARVSDKFGVRLEPEIKMIGRNMSWDAVA